MKMTKFRIGFIMMAFICLAVNAAGQVPAVGDVNADTNINIVDALLIAQYYVGFNPSPFYESAADVSYDNVINIVDALLVAQYYVGIISEFPRPDLVLPEAIGAFYKQLITEFEDARYPHYLIDVKLSPEKIYPQRYIFSIYQDHSVPWPTLLGLFASSQFNVSLYPAVSDAAFIVYPETLTASYQGIAAIDGSLLIQGLMLLNNEYDISAATIGLMGKILLQPTSDERNIYFEYEGVDWRIFRDSNGEITLISVLPSIVIEFQRELEHGFGNRFMVRIEQSPIEIYPPQFIVNIDCITDDLQQGDLSSVALNISADETVIEILTTTIRAGYLSIHPSPDGKRLYEGMYLWLEQTGIETIRDIDPLIQMSKIKINTVTDEGTIYFTDQDGKKWIISDDNGKTVLTPDINYPVPENLEDVRALEPFGNGAEQMLLNNGFVVLDNARYDRLSSQYFKLFRSNNDASTFITTDALLHLFHIVYDSTLKTAEKKTLVLKLDQLLTLMTGCVQDEYNMLPDNSFLKEAARRLWVSFAVAEALSGGETVITASGSEPIREEANLYLTKVYEHTVVEFYPGDDFTLYEPRGHYTGDLQLENYFRALKWISRRIFRVSDPHSIPDSEYELAGAAIMSFLLMNVKNNMHPLWQDIYETTSKFVDVADSITPPMVESAMRLVFGDLYSTSKYNLLEKPENLKALQMELLSDAYPESEIIPVPLQNPGDLPKKYVQFMGERYIIDGEVMQRTCFPDVANRNLPLGLDVAATVFDSTAAGEELAGQMQLFPGLAEQINILKEELAALPESNWQRSTYNQWLYTIRSLAGIAPGASPVCMKSPLWQREKLNTKLASWAELRHDNILYAKETMIPSPWNEGYGIVEPYPAFYQRLEGMCSQLTAVIDSAELDLPVHKSRLNQLASWAKIFGTYAEKIVNNTPLTADEQNFIKQWGLNLLGFFSSTELPEDDPELITDVASSSATLQVLHEAVGKLNPVIIIYTQPEDNKTLAAIGYVMSYYELIEEGSNRLNDDEWKMLLESGSPVRPSWTDGYISY